MKMLKRKKVKKPPQRNWVSISVVEIALVVFLIYFAFEIVNISKLFSLVYFLFLWSLIFVYVLANTLRENPDFEFRKSFVKIKRIEVYESWYFLTALGLIFLFGVIIIALTCSDAWGIAAFGFLFGFLGLWIRDILKKKREKS